MDILEYKGTKYIRTNKNWTDTRGIIAPEIIQKELNSLFLETLDLSDMTVDDLIKQADALKESSSSQHAVKLYEYAVEIAEEYQLARILPRITSCYRKLGFPQKAIDVMSFAKNKYGTQMVTAVLLTSVAAAYCDLKQYENALKCCNKAYAMTRGNASGELASVYGRIRKESNVLN